MELCIKDFRCGKMCRLANIFIEVGHPTTWDNIPSCHLMFFVVLSQNAKSFLEISLRISNKMSCVAFIHEIIGKLRNIHV